jgi:membrane protein
VAGWIWRPEEVTEQVQTQVEDIVGEGGWEQLATMMHAREQGGGDIIATVIGAVMLLVGATGVMLQLQAALNRAWEIKPDPKQGGIKNFILKRLLSVALIMAVAFLLLVSLVLTSFLNAVGGMVTSWLPDAVSQGVPFLADWVPITIKLVVSLLTFTLLFAAMFMWLPDADVRWRDTWIGAFVTAVLFVVGEFLLGLYFSIADQETYGAAASFALLLLWSYYSAMIFLIGAEFTQVWANHIGEEIKPSKGAVHVVTETKQVDTPIGGRVDA